MNTNNQNEKTTGANKSPVAITTDTEWDMQWKKFCETRDRVCSGFDPNKWHKCDYIMECLNAIASASNSETNVVNHFLIGIDWAKLSRIQLIMIAGDAAKWAYGRGWDAAANRP